MNNPIKSGTLIAAAVAAMAMSSFAYAAPTTSLSADDQVHCAGINSCKGMSDCATAENACKGQNACKGHGFMATKAGECFAKKGKITDLNK
ncbi:MAG: hypothetical protein V4754_19430 [Pseudomonadota bacterium]